MQPTQYTSGKYDVHTARLCHVSTWSSKRHRRDGGTTVRRLGHCNVPAWPSAPLRVSIFAAYSRCEPDCAIGVDLAAITYALYM